MALSITVENNCCSYCCWMPSKNTALYLDLIVGLAIVAIGLLTVYGYIGGINALSTSSILGAGCTYTGLALYKLLAKRCF